MAGTGLESAFQHHPRTWRGGRYVYPVISRRSRGLSIGVNLNPDGACNFDCVYCCVDRTAPRVGGRIDLTLLETELRSVVEMRERLFEEPEFSSVPAPYRRLNDIAFSGDGEPTAVPSFPKAVDVAVRVRRDFNLSDVKIVVITDACYLMRANVLEALAVLDANNGEIWAKLDAGTDAHFKQVNRGNVSLPFVVDNILSAARVRPIVIQAMFLRMHGEPPAASEVDAWVARLSDIRGKGGQIKHVQVYTVARQTTESYVTPLTADELGGIAARARDAGFDTELYS